MKTKRCMWRSGVRKAWSEGVVAAVLIALPLAFFRRHLLSWGATADEAASPLSGDDLVPDADLVATRAISVQTSPERVWPWIAQIGQGKGGFYSYDALENLVGCEIHSAHHIHPEWQHPVVGDEVRLHPDIALAVAEVQPGETLVLRGAVPVGGTEGTPPYDFSWAFVLRHETPGGTRLLVRERYGYTAWWARAMVEPVSVVSFLMSQRMLRTIRDRAEAGPGRLP